MSQKPKFDQSPLKEQMREGLPKIAKAGTERWVMLYFKAQIIESLLSTCHRLTSKAPCLIHKSSLQKEYQLKNERVWSWHKI